MSKVAFRALKGGVVIAEARDLGELAAKLKELGVDSRQVEIRSALGDKPRRRFGLRCDRYDY